MVGKRRWCDDGLALTWNQLFLHVGRFLIPFLLRDGFYYFPSHAWRVFYYFPLPRGEGQGEGSIPIEENDEN